MREFLGKREKTIRHQVGVAMILLFLAMLIILYIVINSSMQKLLVEREYDSMLNQSRLAESILLSSVDHLPSVTRDWSSWDNTYDYVLGKNDNFLEENLTDYPFQLFRLDFITVLDLNQQVLYEKFFDTEKSEFVSSSYDFSSVQKRVSPLTLNSFVAYSEQLDLSDSTQIGVSGFFYTEDGVFYITSYPIIHSDESGPSVGTLSFGRIIDQKEISYLTNSTDMQFSVVPVSQLQLTEDQSAKLTEAGELVVTDNNYATAYNLFEDIFGEKSLAISISKERVLYQQGITFISIVIALVFVSCMFILFLLIKLLNKIVVHPISSLVVQLDSMQLDSPNAHIDQDYNNKELQHLATAINHMFSRIAESSAQLYYNANYDGLTDFYNRSSMPQVISNAIEQAKENATMLGIYFLDLDRFKSINDAHGHSAGDMLIKEIGARFKKYLSDDSIEIARMGGDEFLILKKNLRSDQELLLFVDRILSIFENPFHVKDLELTVQASIGSSQYPADGQDENTLVKNAETAMYTSKANGQNLYCRYYSDMQKVLQRKLFIENQLRQGIHNHCADFRAYIQPKVNSETGKAEGGEALIRWLTDDGIIAPGEFIPMAEESGLIVPLTRWMLKESCKCNMQVIRKGTPHHVISVNISAQVLLHSEFIDMVEDALRSSGMDAKYLDIEITEATLADDVKRVNEVIKVLHDMGISLSVDDFGTGYSSLSYLKKLALDRLKIDRSFIIGIEDDTESLAIVSSIIALSKALHMTVTAEGVETAKQYAHLKTLECDEIQGFYISKPIPCDEYIAFLEKWHGE